MSLPRITVITPSFNQGQYIGQTIESVLGQGYPDLEYIVMDGGSTDETLDVLKSYAGRLRWVSERDRGQSHAINKGLQMATGDVVAFLNSDDLYAPGALHAVGEWFSRRPAALWVTGQCRIVDTVGNEVRQAVSHYKNAWLQLCTYSTLLVINYISQPATFWSRKALTAVGYLDESLYYTFDYDYWLRLGRLQRPGLISQPLAHFRVHPSSKGGRGPDAQFAEELSTARRYTTSRALLSLHKAHAALIVATYNRLNSKTLATSVGG